MVSETVEVQGLLKISFWNQSANLIFSRQCGDEPERRRAHQPKDGAARGMRR